MFLYLTIYMQGVLDFSPLETGLRFLPLTVLSFVVAPIAGKLSQRVPIRVLLGIGLALVGAGLLSMHGLSADSDISALLPGFLVAGVGIGTDQPQHRAGGDRRRAAGQSGHGLGDQHDLPPGRDRDRRRLARRRLPVPGRLEALDVLPGAPPGLAEAVASGGSRAAAGVAPPGQRAEIVHAANVAFVSGFNEILLIGAILSFVGAALGFALVRASDFVPASANAEAVEPAPA